MKIICSDTGNWLIMTSFVRSYVKTSERRVFYEVGT